MTTKVAIGKNAEDIAVQYLRDQGFEIIGRNMRAGRLEVDIVAREGDVIMIIEVRHRGTGAWEKPLASITRAKQKRLLTAGAALWRKHLRNLPGSPRLRFDAIAVTMDESGEPHVEHVRGAFTR